MREHELRALIENVREGELPRRTFVQRMVGLGLTALQYVAEWFRPPGQANKPTTISGQGA